MARTAVCWLRKQVVIVVNNRLNLYSVPPRKLAIVCSWEAHRIGAAARNYNSLRLLVAAILLVLANHMTLGKVSIEDWFQSCEVTRMECCVQ